MRAVGRIEPDRPCEQGNRESPRVWDEAADRTMMPINRIVLMTVVFAASAVTAGAQTRPPDNSNISLSAPGLLIKKPKPGAPDVKPQPLAWPRLDAGSVTCRTEDDLNRLSRRRAGEPSDEPVVCQIVRAPTAITIVQRNGPSRTEVKVNGLPNAATVWTDAWLPEKAPGGATSASR